MDALRHLDCARVKHRRLLDVPRENLGPRLVADLERVAEILADDEQNPIALAFEQRIGGDRGAHLDAVDQLCRQRIAPHYAKEIGDTAVAASS